MCGATRQVVVLTCRLCGLSPRVRGNRLPCLAIPRRIGPIPACAGQPGSGRRRKRTAWAYPRVCGATMPVIASVIWGAGLSPRVRGNLQPQRLSARGIGPIPACAGQPKPGRVLQAQRGAYPRVCGATYDEITAPKRAPGLSPRVRGNPQEGCFAGLPCGPIPACAGQPFRLEDFTSLRVAYPRVCGATKVAEAYAGPASGLSPRVRGNRATAAQFLRWPGPIPACAGQPAARFTACTSARAYPRVCGATRQVVVLTCRLCGLSPRVRGNRD